MADALNTLSAKKCSIAVLSLMLTALPVRAAMELPSPQAPSDAAYIPGELLVKFTQEAVEAVEQAREANQLPTIGIESLDALVAKYAVTLIEPVFPQAQDPDAIRLKFPERARRAPAGAELPDLSRTYKLTFDPQKDVLEALVDFLADPSIESAEPDYLATIQAPPEPTP